MGIHTSEVQGQLQLLRSLLLDTESNQRGFLPGSRPFILRATKPPSARCSRKLRSCALPPTTLSSRRTSRQLDPLVAAKLDFMAQTISLQQHGEHEALLALITTDRGKQTMDAIRSRLELMEKEESRLLTTREESLASRARFSTWFLCALVALNLLFAIAMLLLFRRLSLVQNLVTVCAWSRTVEYEGEWISFEQYLLRRFNLNTSHGIPPDEAEKVFGETRGNKENEWIEPLVKQSQPSILHYNASILMRKPGYIYQPRN